MYKLNCGELTNTTCDFIAEGETKDETKNKFYAHGAEAPIHKEKYETASEEEKSALGKVVDGILDAKD